MTMTQATREAAANRRETRPNARPLGVMGLITLLTTWLLASVPGQAAEDVPRAVTYGGRLYDSWFLELRHKPPRILHPLYPVTGKYASDPARTWQCAECHGWGYRGEEGTYGKSSDHHTGIVGIQRMNGADPARIVTVLTHPGHGYDAFLYDDQIEAMAAFVSGGQVNVNDYIDPATGGRARGQGSTDTILCDGVQQLL
ncbi:MAG: hypothetical protein FD153_75 [Rhodospirillaceae bacterium]|nr:MAG: hypothetical protein FD153_75 [Rhodospirillaceae bacterium]